MAGVHKQLSVSQAMPGIDFAQSGRLVYAVILQRMFMAQRPPERSGSFVPPSFSRQREVARMTRQTSNPCPAVLPVNRLTYPFQTSSHPRVRTCLGGLGLGIR